MRMKKIHLLFLMMIASFASFAQQEKGDQVIRFFVNFNKQESADAMMNLNFKYGKFITQNIELGLSPSLSLGGGSTTLSFEGYGNYNFLLSDSKVVPYVGANLGVITIETKGADESTSAFTYGANAGFRYFISEKVNVDTGLAYSAFTLEGISSSQIDLNIGLGIIIGSLK
jgi:hypothetical protein